MSLKSVDLGFMVFLVFLFFFLSFFAVPKLQNKEPIEKTFEKLEEMTKQKDRVSI